ncbi:MAG: D-lyxose ketol-isomerase [Chloroflexota bacterium]
MDNEREIQEARQHVATILRNAGITLTALEAELIEIVDCGLHNLLEEGLQLVTYVNNERYCAKELVLFPNQTFPQHRHPPLDGGPGKQETFRCRFGRVYLYVSGDAIGRPHCQPPRGSAQWYNVWREIELNPGDQYTIDPDTWHWFQAGDHGAIVSEFSSSSTDYADIFADARIVRMPAQ